MKLLIFLVLLLPFSIFAQSVGDQKFIQEVVTIHSSKEGLPEGRIDKMVLENEYPVAEASGKRFGFKDSKWSVIKADSKGAIASQLPVIPGAVILSSVPFKDGYAIGCNRGFIFTIKLKNQPESFLQMIRTTGY